MAQTVNRKQRETARRVLCHFCDWSMKVTEVDLRGDTIDAYDRHLRRHAEAADMQAVDNAVFDALMVQLDTP